MIYKIIVIIVNYNKNRDTLECLNSLKKVTYPIYGVIIIDNSTNEDSCLYDYSVNDGLIKYIKIGENIGFAEGNNVGIKEALTVDPDYILLLNNDTVVKEDFLDKLIEPVVKHKVDLATGKIYYYDKPDTIWGAGGKIDWKRGMGVLYGINKKDKKIFNVVRDVSFISGCMMFIKKDVFMRIGCLSDDFFMYCEDVDFCLRALKADLKMIYVPESVIWHRVGAKEMNGSAFHFYYFIRNSLIIVLTYGRFFQKSLFFLFIFPYSFYKIVLSKVADKTLLFKIFIMAFRDKINNKLGYSKQLEALLKR
ncbi:MAG: glycosyltransferase family 2 protein [Candidatus Omnitrophota bacterium]